MIPVKDPTTLSLLFHLNSEPWLDVDAYRAAAAGLPVDDGLPVDGGLDDGGLVDGGGLDDAAEVALPDAAPTALDRLLAGRRSCRAFAPAPMPLAVLASLLGAAYGTVGRGTCRAVPSAGGLYPLDPWVFGHGVEGLDDGLWRYDPVVHSLRLARGGDAFATLEATCYAWPFVEHANVVVALAATFARTQAKYGPRGYRYVLLEAGHAAQNLCLQAAALGLATLCVGGFTDSRLNQVLGLDPLRAGVVYAVAVGTAAATATATAAGPPGDDHRGGRERP